MNDGTNMAQRYEREIPEGYEARIEGNKVIIELKETESEEERIRKELIKFISDIKRISENGRETWAVRKSDADMCAAFLSYLEKQKGQKPLTVEDVVEQSKRFGREVEVLHKDEQKPAEEQKEQKPISFNIPFNPDDYEVVMEGNAISLKRKEQKSAEWDELQSEFRNVNEAFEDGKKEVVAHPEKYDLCKPAEWSEEDKKILDELLDHCNTENATWYKFLKSLRPQPKQEWSEEDEKMVLFWNMYYEHEIDDWLNKDVVERLEEFKKWLNNRFKFLRPQPKQEWSEEDSIGKKIDKYFSEHPYLKDLYEDNALSFDGAARYFYTEGQLAATKRIRQEEKTEQWTDDDEEHLKWVCRIVHGRRVEGEISLAEESELGKWMDKWLNHEPQPKQEWDEEDEMIFKHCLVILHDYGYDEWLKSHLSYSHWKPSEEQMEALDKAIPVCMGVVGRDAVAPLESLYEQLKAL